MATDAPSAPDDTDHLVEAARAGDRGALARLLSMVERGGDGAHGVGVATHSLGGATYTVGLTGAPGAGKSTLTAGVVGHLRERGAEAVVLGCTELSVLSEDLGIDDATIVDSIDALARRVVERAGAPLRGAGGQAGG